MNKSLTQTTLDFSAPEKKEVIELSLRPPVVSEIPEIESEPIIEDSTPIKLMKQPSTRGRKSLKDNGAEAELVQIPDDEILFTKQYYGIGEVATMFRVNASLLRFWENEFDILQPRKNRKGDRFFRPQDIKNLVLIHDLLRKRKFTIEGAKDWLKKNSKAEEKFAAIQSLQKIRAFMLELKASL